MLTTLSYTSGAVPIFTAANIATLVLGTNFTLFMTLFQPSKFDKVFCKLINKQISLLVFLNNITKKHYNNNKIFTVILSNIFQKCESAFHSSISISFIRTLLHFFNGQSHLSFIIQAFLYALLLAKFQEF